MRGKPHTTTLPDGLAQYVEGLAKIKGLSVSKTLVAIVQEHFDRTVQNMHKEKRRGSKA